MRSITIALVALSMAPTIQNAHAVDFTVPTGGIVCSSVSAAEAMADLNPSPRTTSEAETLLANFNIPGERHCDILWPAMVEHPHFLGSHKTADGYLVVIYSFELEGQVYYTTFPAEIPFA